MKPNKVPSFTFYNPTNRFVVLVDGYFGYFDDEKTAQAVFKEVCDQFEGLHGVADLLEPHQEPKEGYSPCTDYQPIDIADYIFKSRTRPKGYYCPPETKSRLPSRFALKRFWDAGGFLEGYPEPEDVRRTWEQTVHGVDFEAYIYTTY